MSHLSLLNSYYPSSVSLLNPHHLALTNSSYSNLEQAIYQANLISMQQQQQQLQLKAQIQALANIQAQNMMLNRQSFQQTYYPTTDVSKLYEKKMKLACDIHQTEDTFKEQQQVKVVKRDLETEIRGMLSYFTDRFNRSNQQEIAQEKHKYNYSQILTQLFDQLIKKYSAASRCREDMLRFVLRKAMTFLRNRLREQHVLGARAASILMCKRYFGQRMTEMLENVNIEDEKEVVAFLLPYKKGSRNRTANSRFMNEIFGSDEFRQDYACYIEKLDEILNKDNQKKMEKFEAFLVDCVKQNTIDKVQKFKRLPWVEEWLESTKVIAKELLTHNQKDTFFEGIKAEISSSASSSKSFKKNF